MQRVDHTPVAVRDLDQAAVDFARLVVSGQAPRRRPAGSANVRKLKPH